MNVRRDRCSTQATKVKKEDLQNRRQFADTILRDLGKSGIGFTDTDIMLLLDAANGQRWTGMLDRARCAKMCLKSFRDDPNAYEQRWDVDARALVKKIDSLTDGQACFLGGFLRGYWQREGESA